MSPVFIFFKSCAKGDEHQRKTMVENIPAGRLAEPNDIIGKVQFSVLYFSGSLGPILFFASRASDYCTGSQLVVDGGISSNTF